MSKVKRSGERESRGAGAQIGLKLRDQRMQPAVRCGGFEKNGNKAED